MASEERLAEIRQRVNEAGYAAANTPDPEWAYNLHSLGTELLAEVERLRARAAALVAVSPYSHKRVIELIDEKEHLLDVIADERLRAETAEAEVERLRAREAAKEERQAALLAVAVNVARIDERGLATLCDCRETLPVAGHVDDCWVLAAHIEAHRLPSGEIE